MIDLKSVSILNKQGEEVGKLFYDPAVIESYRHSGAARRLQKRVSALADANTTPEGKGRDAQSEALIRDAEAAVMAFFKRATGADASPVFARYRPFAVLASGDFYINQVMRAFDVIAGGTAASHSEGRE